MRILLSTAQKILGLKRTAYSIPQHLSQTPLALSRYIIDLRPIMAQRQHTQLAPNGVSQPLALAGGAPLKVKNSLSKDKEIFKPAKENEVTWYSCGPTVYDSSHLGHARTYVSMDIIRRILQGYFGYNVNFVQNVTDIDDKIIIRARQTYLWKEYLKSPPQIRDIETKVLESWKLYATKILSRAAVDRYQMDQDLVSYFNMHLNALLSARKGILDKNPDTYFENVKDVYLPILDKEQAANFTELSIFQQFTAYWEQDYNTDMRALSVLTPTKIIRVSEVVPEIVLFVSKIVDSGFAYATSAGDVYFDVHNFQQRGHQYAKLKPNNAGDTEKLLAEGEGSLSGGGGKKSSVDFALWKSSKPGEPRWQSPWGEGRPGWHIECSVMASEAFGANMDIHSGGIDLAFPHHDNELAQSEAYHDCHRWVNYFLHTGHLSIEGQKMSKSLKNFITIKEALGRYTARQLRLGFLTTAWDGPMDFKEEAMEEMKSLEEKLCVWFSKAELILEKVDAGEIKGTVSDDAVVKGLKEKFRDAKEAVHLALADNFNTRGGMSTISELLNVLNKEFLVTTISSSHSILLEITQWITDILATFGFERSTAQGRLGWSEDRDSLLPIIKKAVRYRDSVRAKAISKSPISTIDTLTWDFDNLKTQDPSVSPYISGIQNFVSSISKLVESKAAFQEFLTECDRFRDETMLELGVSVSDTDFGIATIRFADAARLIAERDQKRVSDSALAKKRAAEKLKRQEEERRRVEEKLMRGKVPPSEMFRTPEYSQWDDEGLPTHDAEGEEITKGKRKKLVKDREGQKKLHEAYLNWVAGRGQ